MEKLKRIKEMYANSLKELFVTKNIVLCGLMAALAVVLSMTASVEVGPYIRIGFSGIPNRVIECLLGPVAGCLFGGALEGIAAVLRRYPIPQPPLDLRPGSGAQRRQQRPLRLRRLDDSLSQMYDLLKHFSAPFLMLCRSR